MADTVYSDDPDWFEEVRKGGLDVTVTGRGLGNDAAKRIAMALMHPDTKVQSLSLEGNFRCQSANRIEKEGAIAIANA